MTYDEFDAKFLETIPLGIIFQNPKKGVSEVCSNQNGVVSYRRASSKLSISRKSLFDVFTEFQGKRMSSSELKARWPAIFDPSARPAGHSCHVTFLFLVLKKMEICSDIKGKGVRGNSFFVEVY